MSCPQFPGKISYPSDINGTLPGVNASARCTVGSLSARNLTHTTDLYRAANGSEAPPVGLNESFAEAGYEEAYFVATAEKLIAEHGEKLRDLADQGQEPQPFFLYYAMHLFHSPLCVPPAYLDKFSFIGNENRRYVSAMALYLDDVVSCVCLCRCSC